MLPLLKGLDTPLISMYVPAFITLATFTRNRLSYTYLKRRLSSGERWTIICNYASVEKARLFKCLHILNMTCNSFKMRASFLWYMFVQSYIHLSVYIACYFYQNCATFPIMLTIPELCSTHNANMINFFWSIPHRFFHNAKPMTRTQPYL